MRTVAAPAKPDPVRTLDRGAVKIRRDLGWEPQFANLDTIVAHALAWEGRLAAIKKAS